MDDQADDGIGWPSYVDFLSTFVMILILFLACIVFFVSDVQNRAKRQRRVNEVSDALAKSGIQYQAVGDRIVISLKNKVEFRTKEFVLDDKGRAFLRSTAKQLSDTSDVKHIIVQGRADSDPFANDEFGNWKLSAQRALEVLQFLYNCENCAPGVDLKSKLVLAGEGDTEARRNVSTEEKSKDRSPDVILDFADSQ